MRFLLLSLLAFWSTQAISKDYSFYHHKSSLKKIANEQDQQTFKHIFTQKHKPAALFCKKSSKQKVKKDKNKKRLKRVLKKMKRAIFHSKWGKKIFSSPYELVELENENPDLLEIKLNPKKKRRAKSKYTPVEVIYKLVKKGESKRKARRHKLDISNFKFAIDLANQDVGDYELYLTLVSYKTSHLKRRFKFKYFHFAKLEISKELPDAVITPKLALIEKRHNDSWLVFDLAESSVTHGQLDKFIVRVLKDEVEIEQKEFSFSETSQFEYIFTQAASYQFEVEVFNSLGGSQKVLSQTFDVQHFAPTVGYSLEAKAGHTDIYKINFDQTTLPTSANGFSFFAARVYQEGILVDEKVTNTKEFEFQIKARGEFELQLYVGADNGTLNYVSDPNVYFIDESVPQSLFLNYSHHFFDEIDPRKLYVAFKNEITQQQFKQFNVSLKHLASGQTQNYVSDIYIYDQMILHALVGSYEPGEYEFTLELELNDGTKSAPFVITENFDFDLGQVALDIEVTPVSGKARTYLFDASASTPGNYGEFSLLGCEFRHEANNFSTQYSLKEGPLELKVPFAGTWQMNCLGETSLGLSASYSQTFVVDNIKPVASFEIIALDEQLRSYEFQGSYSDPDGSVVAGILQMTTPTGDYYEYPVANKLPLSLTTPGIYTFSYRVKDNNETWSEAQTKTVEIINHIPLADFSITKVGPRKYYITPNSSDSDGSVVQASYSFQKGGEERFTIDSLIGFEADLSAGEWNIELKVKDNNGAYSSKKIVSILVENEKPLANFVTSLSADKKTVSINANASDLDGNIQTYYVKATDVEGKQENFSFSMANFSIDLQKPGIWKLQLWVSDNEGALSNSTLVDIEIPDFSPIASFEIIKNENHYTLNASNSSDDYKVEAYHFKLTSPAAEVTSFDTQIVSDAGIDLDGKWQIDLYVTDNAGNISETISKEIMVDLLPPDPGEQNNQTLAGIDSDNDGVRDDVERYIASLSLDENITQALKEFSRINQDGILNAAVREDSIQSTYDKLSYEYCLRSKMSDEEAQTLSNAIIKQQHNTKERVLAWVRSQHNFAGEIVVTVNDRNEFNEYCDYKN